MKVIAATKNAGKLREMKSIFEGLDYDIISAHELGIDAEPEENGASFEENALIKARAVAELCDLAVIADDSGLCVDALGGAPGIYSARWAGEDASDSDRINKLLSELAQKTDRRAKFVSAVAFIFPDGDELTARGEVFGRICEKPCGCGGFGYDPVFFSDELGKTFAEASEEEKNKVSHRARALGALCDMIAKRR